MTHCRRHGCCLFIEDVVQRIALLLFVLLVATPLPLHIHALAPQQQLGSFEALDQSLALQQGKRKVVLEDLVVVSMNSDDLVDFHKAWDWQKYVAQEHMNRLTETPERSSFLDPTTTISIDDEKEPLLLPGGVDTIFMLEHSAVYTLVGHHISRYDSHK